MYSEGTRYKKSVSRHLVVFQFKAAPTTDGPQREIQEMRERHIMAHRLILYILFVEFCFGRSYSELNFQSNRYESNR